MALEQSQNQNSRWSVAGVFLLKLCLVVLLACAAAVAYLALRSHDPVYVLREFKDWTDYRRFDSLIVKVGREYDLDPRLIKAVVWRESRFQADMIGRNGERGHRRWRGIRSIEGRYKCSGYSTIRSNGSSCKNIPT